MYIFNNKKTYSELSPYFKGVLRGASSEYFKVFRLYIERYT